MPPASLTTGAIAMICAGEAELKPTLQVIDIRLVNTAQNTNERYRMVLSDGEHIQQSMLATQLNPVVKSGRLQKGSIVQLTEFICNVIQNRKIIIVISLEVVAENSEPIGDPKPYAEGNTMSSSVSQPKVAMPGQVLPMNQTGAVAAYPQAYTGPSPGFTSFGQNISSGSMPQPSIQHGGNAQSDNGLSGGPGFDRIANDGVPQYHKAEYGATSIGGYANQVQKLGNTNPSSMPTGASWNSSNSYGQSAPSSYNSHTSAYSNRGPIGKNDSPVRIVVPIAALNPYQGRWTIKARVTVKTEIRRFSSPKMDGKVFSFDLLDSSGGEIRATCFNAACDQFYSQIESGKVYLISKGALKPAAKKFNPLNNEWEITLDSNSTIQLCPEEDSSIPKLQFNFRQIVDIEAMEVGTMLDLIAIVFSASPSTTVIKKDGTETIRRSLQLKDMSGRSVELMLWGNLCTAEGQQVQDLCDSGACPVLAVKTARINEYQGRRNLNTLGTSQLIIDPKFPEASKLLEWYSTEGKNVSSVPISKEYGKNEIRKTVSQIKDEGLGRSEKPDWITVDATIIFIKAESVVYPACPLMSGDRRCNKKAVNNGDGMWHCEKCDQSFPQCEHRYLLTFQIADHTGVTWVTAFQEVGEEIFGRSAKEMYTLKFEEFDDAKYSAIVRGILFTRFLFKLKVQEETYGDEHRVKSIVYKVERISFPHDCKYLLSLVDGLSLEDSSAARTPLVGMATNSSMPHHDSMSMRQNIQSVGNGYGGSFSERYGATLGNHSGNSSGMAGPNGSYNMCGSCGIAGHQSQNCPRLVSGQGHQQLGGGYQVKQTSYNGMGGGGDNSSGKCFKCNQSGHWARDCPSSGINNNARYGGYPRG